MAAMDVSKYAHSPVHKAVITRDYAALKRILDSLPSLAKPSEIRTEAASIAEEDKADAISAIIDRRDVPNRETAETSLIWREESKMRMDTKRKGKSYSPNAVGVNLILEKIFPHSSVDIRNFRCENHISMLVCSKGGGGLLQEHMEIVAELWQANLKAELVPLLDPSLTEQYEYASEHDLKCLIVITEVGLSQTGLVKVRHLELKKEWEVDRNRLVKFLTEAISTQFQNLPNWN